ncbi:MAG: YraN family protein [Clostridia bacterium]|nr:YraN family protein [Clostridia bacterium]
MIRNKVGVWGEVFAARYLRDNGYDILSSNYVCRFGEIDIIAEKDGVISFVEVKTRNRNTSVRPMEAVDEGKQKRLEMSAKSFLSAAKINAETGFDVCEVYLDDNCKLCGINYIKNAFQVMR